MKFSSVIKSAMATLLTGTVCFAGSLPAEAAGITGLTASSAEKPVSLSPILRWDRYTDAVCFELELFDERPVQLKTDETSPAAIWHNEYIYKNACNVPLYKIVGEDFSGHLWWRVRPLNFDHEPIDEFSSPAEIFVSDREKRMNSPEPMGEDAPKLLYPVYSWVGQHDADKYKVEIYSGNPAKSAKAVLLGTLDADFSEKYDDVPRQDSPEVYWRVHAYDKDGEPLGQWSAPKKLKRLKGRQHIAVYGDSISHGGGRMSYGPDIPEYSYPTYLDFRAGNLACSGRTTADMVEHFRSDILPSRPRYLIILGGSNDLRAEWGEPAETIDNLRQLSELCVDNGIRPVFLTLPPINPKQIAKAFGDKSAADWRTKFDTVNEYIRTLPHIDAAAPLEKLSEGREMPAELAVDGLHGDVEAKRIMAASINKNWAMAKKAADRWYKAKIKERKS
ncbi:MAG: GDSL-type esterase/lipase family protein [Selenomonadaceae bacterium]|nr:GDSL-type esterase/lipase family protein [Selenomonadaceae bacterium]